MSTHTLLAMRYSQDRSDDRPSKPSIARQARIIVSWTASSASDPEPEHAVAEAGELPPVGLERPVEVGPGEGPRLVLGPDGFVGVGRRGHGVRA